MLVAATAAMAWPLYRALPLASTFILKKPRLWTELIGSELYRLENEPTDDGQLKLSGRRFLHTMNSWMHNSDKVIRNAKPTLLMHPLDAEARQIADGQMVRLHNQNGEIEVQVEISETVLHGSVNYPHGFGHQHGSWRLAKNMEGEKVEKCMIGEK